MKIPVKHNLINRSAAVLLALIGIVISSHAAAAQNPNPGTAPVTVQNTSAHPVPITGEVVVTNQILQPTTSAFSATVSCPGALIRTCDLYTVPSGKRAVIEYFSLEVDLNGTFDGVSMRPSLDTTLSGTKVRSYIQPLPITGSVDTGTGQVVHLYADPGTIVVARIATNFGLDFSMSFSINGYLVDLP